MGRSGVLPSMFHRRLLLLFGACAVVSVVLGGQTARLTLIKGEELRAEAQSKLVRTLWVPTTRGRILDRHGRVLAVDRPSYALAVPFDVLTGSWVDGQSERQARIDNIDRWDTLSDAERAGLVRSARGRFEERVEEMWREVSQSTGVSREELAKRASAAVERVERMYEQIVDRRIASAVEERRVSGRRLDAAAMGEIEKRARTPIGEQRANHILVRDVADEVGFRLLRLAEEQVEIPAARAGLERTIPRLAGLEVIDTADRLYPFDEVSVDVDTSTLPGPLRSDGSVSIDAVGVGWHVLGRVRAKPTREEIEARASVLSGDDRLRSRSVTASGIDRGQYFANDMVGIAGIESAREHELRGLRGVRTMHLDTGAVEEVSPMRGEDVYLTLDVMLQARVQAVMDPALGLAQVQEWHGNENLPVGTGLYGAAVVLDIERAEILALVSTPHVPRDGLWSDDESVNERFVATFAPYTNRAIAKPYPPGSIAKAMMLTGAVTLGRLDLDHGIACTGHLLSNQPELFRCWIYKQYNMVHSPNGEGLLAPEALQRSCNIYFYTLGQRMGPRHVASVYEWFGVGGGFGLGIGPEWAGQIGAMGSTAGDGSDLGIQDAILMGIGQGPVTWTPLHAADAYATLARAGYRVSPRLVASDASSAVSRDLGLDRRAVAEALEGLSLSVNHQNGTGHHITLPAAGGGTKREKIFDVPGVEVWGKTGTATAPDLRFDADGDGPMEAEVLRSGDHSWFVVLVGPTGEGPRYAIAVVMDYAGSGGRVSGPITNQIIWALRREGYL